MMDMLQEQLNSNQYELGLMKKSVVLPDGFVGSIFIAILSQSTAYFGEASRKQNL